MDKPVAETAAPTYKGPVYAWWLVLGLVGLDYFSTLAYLPSIAVQADRAQAPLAALGLAALTLFVALPIYLYVVGRSPHGQGGIGLLERLLHGWRGKFLILILLGFVATDFVITRTLSVADASRHLLHNPYWKDHVEWVTNNKETVRGWLPEFLRGGFLDFWNEQLVVTLVLSILAFGFYFYVLRGFTPSFMRLAALVVVLFLVVNGIVIAYGLAYLARHPGQVDYWYDVLHLRVFGSGRVPDLSDQDTPMPARVIQTPTAGGLLSLLAFLVLPALMSAPQLILGLSGFELSMTSAPLVRGRPDDDPSHPRGRIRRTRLLLVTAALLMSAFLVGSVLVVSQLVPPAALQGGADPAGEWDGPAMHRSLAYLAHGGTLAAPFAPNSKDRVAPIPASEVSPLFGPAFGTLYDISSVLILCLAGASVTIGLRQVVPVYLTRFGMQMQWAARVNVILHLFNVTILVVILVFHASVAAQQWAYGASVLALLAGATLACLLDLLRRAGKAAAYLGVVPALAALLLFVAMGVATLLDSRSALYIPLLFVGVLLVTAFVSRWRRATELRFSGFEFTDEASMKRWEEICQLEFQVLVPHRPDGVPLADKDRAIRARHRLAPGVPIIYIEAEVGDPSDFLQEPLMNIAKHDGFEVIRVSHCASIAHVLAAIGLEFRHVGQPPEIHFGWSEEAPLAATVGFLLFGEGNIPLMVHALIRKAEHDPERRPRVVIG